MTAECYKFTVEQLERHYGRQFGAAETRKRLLNWTYDDVRGCSDAALMRAADKVMMAKTVLPSLQDFASAIKSEQLADAAKDDAAQERRAAQHQYGDHKNEPLPQSLKNILSGMASNKWTRSEWIILMRGLAEKYPESNINPNEYVEYLARLEKTRKIDMNAPVGSGASGLLAEG